MYCLLLQEQFLLLCLKLNIMAPPPKKNIGSYLPADNV
jgi:hypothetical protein